MIRSSDVAMEAWVRFVRAYGRLMRSLDAELDAEHGLPLVEYEVLLYLAEAPDRRMRMSELADSLILSRSGVTRLVDRLTGTGLVEKVSCPTDRRGVFAQLTDTGLDRFRQASGTHLRGIEEHFSSRFSKTELRQLAGLLERLGGST